MAGDGFYCKDKSQSDLQRSESKVNYTVKQQTLVFLNKNAQADDAKALRTAVWWMKQDRQ